MITLLSCDICSGTNDEILYLKHNKTIIDAGGSWDNYIWCLHDMIYPWYTYIFLKLNQKPQNMAKIAY